MVVIQKIEYNILLLGQTGVGKSMFINGFRNYLDFATINEALLAPKASYCIPTIFEWYYSNYECCTIPIGLHQDEGERQEMGQSATQCVRSYLFDFGPVAIRFIDTPGFGDTDGKLTDERICENLLQFLSVSHELQNLHGIIFLFKPNDNRMTIFFKYCLEQILSKLHKDSCSNIVFVFTHTKGTNYTPGATLHLLKKIISESNINVDCSKKNIFCMENDCIKLLLAYFYNQDNLTFPADMVDLYEKPWTQSSHECIRLIKYIQRLIPHPVEDTVRINRFRHYSVKLQQQFEKILRKISEDIKKCMELEREITNAQDDLERLGQILYMKTTKRWDMKQYHLVCYNLNCSKKKDHEQNITACCTNCKAWYKSLCTQITGWNGMCKVCKCNSFDHAFKQNLTETKFKKDEKLEGDMNHKREVLNKTRLMLFQQKIDIQKYYAERAFIQTFRGKLSSYLTDNSIFSDQREYEGVDRLTPTTSEEISEMLKILPTLEMTGNDIMKIFNEEDMQLPEEKVYHIDPQRDWEGIVQATI